MTTRLVGAVGAAAVLVASCGGSGPTSRSPGDEEPRLEASDLERLVVQHSDVPPYLKPVSGSTGPSADAAGSLGAVGAYTAGFGRAESRTSKEEPLREVFSTAYLFEDEAAAVAGLDTRRESTGTNFTVAGVPPAVTEVPVEGLPEGAFGLLVEAGFIIQVHYGWRTGAAVVTMSVHGGDADTIVAEGLQIANNAAARRS